MFKGILCPVDFDSESLEAQTKSLCESTTKSCCAGHPAKEIIKAAEEVQAELVVMATHGRTGMSHLVLGSVTEEVVRRSPCAVLAIRMKPRPQISQGG